MSLRPTRGIFRTLKCGRNGLQCFSHIQFAVELPIPISLCSRQIQMKLLDFLLAQLTPRGRIRPPDSCGIVLL